MEVQDKTTDGKKTTAPTISSFPDFAQIFAFLQLFGAVLHLPPVTLKDLEDFFTFGYRNDPSENNMVYIHWRLVNNVSRSESQKEWQRTAVKFAKKNGLIQDNVPYSDIEVGTRVKLLKLACEDQFEYNVSFRKELKDVEMVETQCVGVDSNGQRHWLLQDSNFDVRLYGERNYDEEPPAEAEWLELARCLPGLRRYISTLEARRGGGDGGGGEGEEEKKVETVSPDKDSVDIMEVEAQLNGVLEEERTDVVTRSNNMDVELAGDGERAGTSTTAATGSEEIVRGNKERDGDRELPVDGGVGEREGGKSEPLPRRPKRRASSASKNETSNQPKERASGKAKRKKKSSQTVLVVSEAQGEEGGCLKCLRDVDYEQMLLCDECDKECHTYCQYPRLWTIPKGKWICPICSETQLIDALKALYHRLSEAREQYEKALERKQRSVARLQKSGLLVQNIIEDADDGRRSRRSRKSVNYAELNDVYLPPLGPQDMIGANPGGVVSIPGTRSRTRRNDVYIQEDYLAPRVRSMASRRRWREIEEDDEEEVGGEKYENGTISHSLETYHQGSLAAVTEKEGEEGDRVGEGEEGEEGEDTSMGSATPKSVQDDPQDWLPVEVAKKKTRFACLENESPSPLQDDLMEQHSTILSPAPLRQADHPPFFGSPLNPPVSFSHTPPFHNNPFLPGTPYPIFGGSATMPSKQFVNRVPQGSHFVNKPNISSCSDTSLLTAHHRLEENSVEETAARSLAPSSSSASLLSVGHYKEMKNLSQDY